jgi:hypothetical protein
MSKEQPMKDVLTLEEKVRELLDWCDKNGWHGFALWKAGKDNDGKNLYLGALLVEWDGKTALSGPGRPWQEKKAVTEVVDRLTQIARDNEAP